MWPQVLLRRWNDPHTGTIFIGLGKYEVKGVHIACNVIRNKKYICNRELYVIRSTYYFVYEVFQKVPNVICYRHFGNRVTNRRPFVSYISSKENEKSLRHFEMKDNIDSISGRDHKEWRRQGFSIVSFERIYGRHESGQWTPSIQKWWLQVLPLHE